MDKVYGLVTNYADGHTIEQGWNKIWEFEVVKTTAKLFHIQTPRGVIQAEKNTLSAAPRSWFLFYPSREAAEEELQKRVLCRQIQRRIEYEYDEVKKLPVETLQKIHELLKT